MSIVPRNFGSSRILVIRGVFPGEFTQPIDTIMQPRPPPITVDIYSKIPAKFTSVESWPRETNLLCWRCNRLPQSYPAFLPTNPKLGAAPSCDPVGNFCGWNCVAGHIETTLPEDARSDARYLICFFESLFTGQRRQRILPSPPPYEMKTYGGTLSTVEYQAKIDELNANYAMGVYKLSDFCI